MIQFWRQYILGFIKKIKKNKITKTNKQKHVRFEAPYLTQEHAVLQDQGGDMLGNPGYIFTLASFNIN